MVKKNIVVTSRGLKLNMDALKKSQSTATRIIAGRQKEKPVKTVVKTIVAGNSKPRIKATIPAASPENSRFLPSKVEEPQKVIESVSTPVSVPAQAIAETPEEAEEKIREFEHVNKKSTKKG